MQARERCDLERSIQNIELDYTHLFALVRRAFPDCPRVDDWKILHGGALNTHYQFHIGFDAFVLRIYARNRAHCKTEKAIYQLIHTSVSVPKLIYADEENKPWAFSIFEFVPGQHISSGEEDQQYPINPIPA